MGTKLVKNQIDVATDNESKRGRKIVIGHMYTIKLIISNNDLIARHPVLGLVWLGSVLVGVLTIISLPVYLYYLIFSYILAKLLKFSLAATFLYLHILLLYCSPLVMLSNIVNIDCFRFSD